MTAASYSAEYRKPTSRSALDANQFSPAETSVLLKVVLQQLLGAHYGRLVPEWKALFLRSKPANRSVGRFRFLNRPLVPFLVLGSCFSPFPKSLASFMLVSTPKKGKAYRLPCRGACLSRAY